MSWKDVFCHDQYFCILSLSIRLCFVQLTGEETYLEDNSAVVILDS